MERTLNPDLQRPGTLEHPSDRFLHSLLAASPHLPRHSELGIAGNRRATAKSERGRCGGPFCFGSLTVWVRPHGLGSIDGQRGDVLGSRSVAGPPVNTAPRRTGCGATFFSADSSSPCPLRFGFTSLTVWVQPPHGLGSTPLTVWVQLSQGLGSPLTRFGFGLVGEKNVPLAKPQLGASLDTLCSEIWHEMNPNRGGGEPRPWGRRTQTVGGGEPKP